LQEYKGYATQLENGISLFKDSRSVLSGNDGQLKLQYYSDTGSQYAQVKFNSAISGPLFIKSENKPN
jgi:hypothetical protein